MSMGLTNLSAQKVINTLSESNLKLIIKVLGEERSIKDCQKYCQRTNK